MTEPTIQPPDEDDVDVDEPDPAPLSFFADKDTDRSKLTPHELADVEDRDDRIATNVWRIYLNKLAGRGLITPKSAGRGHTSALLADTLARGRRHGALAPERHDPDLAPTTEPKEQPTMPKHEDEENGTASSAAREAAESLAKAHGRPPTIVEVKRVIAKDYPDASGSLIRQTLKRAGIAFTAVRNAADQKKPAPKKASASSPTRKLREEQAAAPEGGAGAYLAIMALQTLRAKVAAQLEAIDTTIEALRR